MEVKQQTGLGTFICNLETLGELLGFPETTKIRLIHMLPHGTAGGDSLVRFVIEDPGIDVDDPEAEIQSISPQFELLSPNKRTFLGLHLMMEKEPVSFVERSYVAGKETEE